MHARYGLAFFLMDAVELQGKQIPVLAKRFYLLVPVLGDRQLEDRHIPVILADKINTHDCVQLPCEYPRQRFASYTLQNSTANS